MAEPWGDRVRLSGDGYYDHINGYDSGQGDPYLCEAAVRHAMPDEIDIYRAIKAAGVRKHIDIAKVVASLFSIKEG